MGLNDTKEDYDISAMAADLVNSLPFSMPELRGAFTDTQIEDLHKLIADVNAATSQNDKHTKLKDNIETAFTLLVKLGVVL